MKWHIAHDRSRVGRKEHSRSNTHDRRPDEQLGIGRVRRDIQKTD